jgi:peroxiredoxin
MSNKMYRKIIIMCGLTRRQPSPESSFVDGHSFTPSPSGRGAISIVGKQVKSWVRVFIFIFLLFLSFCNLTYAMGEKPVKQNKTSALPQAAAIGFTLKDLNGKSHSLSDYKGKVVFLNFWATWCPPCRQEMPSMQKMFKSWDNKKYVMLAVNIGESKSKVASFARENGYTFPILLDTNKSLAREYMVRGIPTTYIISKDGMIVNQIVGAREWSQKEVLKLTK